MFPMKVLENADLPMQLLGYYKKKKSIEKKNLFKSISCTWKMNLLMQDI
jgi:hypothetical protein